MTTQKQIEANRRNAKRSTGPKTAGGKSIAKLNALKHGLCTQKVTITGEDPEEFDALRQRLVREVCPKDVIEEELVDWIAVSMWRMKRGTAFEAALFTYLRLQQEWAQARAELENIDLEQQYADIDLSKLELSDAYIEALTRKYEVGQELESAKSALGKAFETGEKTLMNVMRYKAAAENSLCRALRELDHRRAKRQVRAPKSSNDEEGKSETVITLPASRL